MKGKLRSRVSELPPRGAATSGHQQFWKRPGSSVGSGQRALLSPACVAAARALGSKVFVEAASAPVAPRGSSLVPASGAGAVWAGQGPMGCCLLWPAAAPPQPHPQTSLACLCPSSLCPSAGVWSLSLCGESSAPPPPHLIATPSLDEPGSAGATRLHLCLCPLEHTRPARAEAGAEVCRRKKPRTALDAVRSRALA